MSLLTLEWNELRGDRRRSYGLQVLPQSILDTEPLRVFLLDRTARHLGDAEEMESRRAVLDIDLRIPAEALKLPRELCADARLRGYDPARDSSADRHCVFHNDRFARYLRELAGAPKVISHKAAPSLPQPRSEAEYAALPPGARYLDPEGAVRVKSTA